MRDIPYQRIALVLGIVVVLAVVVPMAVFTFPQVVGGDHSYVVVSSSMRPTFDAGAVVIVNSVSPKSIETGDIVTYREGNEEVIHDGKVNRITHRVVGVNRSGNTLTFRTKGDANDAADPPVPASAVIGRVTFSIPYLGYLISFMTTDLGFATFVGVPLGLLVLGELYDLARAALRSASTTGDGPVDSKAEGPTTDLDDQGSD